MNRKERRYFLSRGNHHERAHATQFRAPVPYTFKLKAMQPTKTSEGGNVRVVDSRNFPVSKHIAAALVTVKPGGIREMHWHPNASAWQSYITGNGRMTVFFPVDNARTMDFNANDVGYVPSNAPHYIENTGRTDLVFLETFAAESSSMCL
jgi:oxalate decarboxylase